MSAIKDLVVEDSLFLGGVNILTLMGGGSNPQKIIVNDTTSGIIGTTITGITDASITKPYVISLDSGVYIEDTLIMKPYVFVVGSNPTVCVIQVNATSKDVIIGADQSGVSNVTIKGATDSGKCGVKYSSASGIATAFFYVDNVRFGANNILVKVIGTSAQSCTVQCNNIRYDLTAYTTGFLSTNDGSGIGTIQIRNATTTAGMGVSVTQDYFAKADGLGCQIVVNSAQINKSGATSGIAFEAINGGSLRITAANIRNWGTAISMPNTGTATNISAISVNFENNTTDVNVAHTSATGKIEGAAKAKIIINDSSTVFVQNVFRYVITVRKKGGDFTTINDAVNFITDNSSSNIYIIDVGAGVFTEPLIDLSVKPYVNIKGQSINSTVIRPDVATHNIFKLGVMNELSFMTLENAGAGYSGIYVLDGGDFSQLHKLTFNNCDTGITIENTTTPSYFFGEYIDFAGAFSYGVKVTSTGAAINFVNLENCYCFPDSGLNTCYLATGATTDLHLEVSGNENTVLGGKGIEFHSGASVDVSSTYFVNFITGISMPNTGTTPTGHFISTKTDTCTTDLLILHTTGAGSFQGVMNSPIINIVSTSTFGVQYMDALLGNKKEIYFDAASFNLVAGSLPTTTAATRATLSTTGFSLINFAGTGGTVFGVSVNFRIPKDYLRNGKFKLVYTSATGTNNIHWQFIVSNKALNGDLATTTETGLNVTSAAKTQYQVGETTFVAPTTVFAVGNTISIRIYRDPGNVLDTENATAYIQGLVFEYESHK